MTYKEYLRRVETNLIARGMDRRGAIGLIHQNHDLVQPAFQRAQACKGVAEALMNLMSNRFMYNVGGLERVG